MKLTVQQVMDATPVVAQIIRDDRAMPQTGKFRLARLHAKLQPEFLTAHAQRDAMIKAYGLHAKRVVQQATEESPMTVEVEDPDNFMVPADKEAEFYAAWKEVASQEIEVEVQPIPLSLLSLEGNGSIAASELSLLGDLVQE